MESTWFPLVRFNKELQWFRGGHGFFSSMESSFQRGFTMVSESTWRVHGVLRFILARNYDGFGVDMDWTWHLKGRSAL